MNILMTGTNSFVGRHLLPLLQNAGYDVFHLLRKPLDHQNQIIWDFMTSFPDKLPICDVVIHLAAYVDFGDQLTLSQYEVNTVSTGKLARYCQDTGASLILASMIGVHGELTEISPDSPISPINHYAMSKYLAERIVQCFVQDAVILRIAGIYGIGGPSHLGLNAAITNAAYYNRPPVLRGAGKARRNYVCVKDVANWIYRLANRRDTEGKIADTGNAKIMYLAGPDQMTIEQYLQSIVDILLPGENIVREDGPDGDDCVVQGTPSEFPLRSFYEYLTELAQAKTKER